MKRKFKDFLLNIFIFTLGCLEWIIKWILTFLKSYWKWAAEKPHNYVKHIFVLFHTTFITTFCSMIILNVFYVNVFVLLTSKYKLLFQLVKCCCLEPIIIHRCSTSNSNYISALQMSELSHNFVLPWSGVLPKFILTLALWKYNVIFITAF